MKKKINRNFKTFVYLDLVYEFEKIELVNHIDKFSDLIFVFSDCWKRNLMAIGINQDKIRILHHGIDKDKFYPVDKLIALFWF